MKKLTFITVFLSIASVLQSQVYKSASSPNGKLYSLLTATEKNTVTNLTIGGLVNACDFKTMRDSMPALVSINLQTASITSYTGTNGTESTGSTIYPASTIPAYAFNGKSMLTSIILPTVLTSIGDSAFALCSGLTDISIPSLVNSIGNYAFVGCNKLTSIVIPSMVSIIEDWTFYSCTSLTSVTIPSSVKEIRAGAFYYCSGLKTVEIPSLVTTIGESAFSNCTGLLSITIPSSVTSLGSSVFKGCSGLTSVTIPSSIKTISSYTFSSCSKLDTIIIPSSVTSLGSYAFSYCSGLTSITIPSSVTTIGNYAFYYCTNLASVDIPSSVTSIGVAAFLYCSGLKSLSISPSVTELKTYTFGRCTSLTSVDIPSSVKTIGDYAFYYCTGLKKILIPTSVTSIGVSAFFNCTSLLSVNIPTSITSINKFAFSSCSALISVSIPSSVTTICSDAFGFCTGLKSLIIPSSVTAIDSNAFSYCYSLASVFSYATTPADLSLSRNVFLSVNQATCKLYVPSGSLSLYQSADKWKDFTNIVALEPYYNVTPLQLYYIVGLGDGTGNNSTSAIGSSLIPMSLVIGDNYISGGSGIYTYTGYLKSSKGFKIIRDVGSMAEQWGMSGDVYVHNITSSDSIKVSSNGFYTIILNSISNVLTIEANTTTTTAYNDYTSMGFIGDFNSWATDVPMKPSEKTNNHVWYATYTLSTDGGIKFRANGSSAVNWGNTYFAQGIGVNNGTNIPSIAGNYTIVFNDIDGTYYFFKQNTTGLKRGYNDVLVDIYPNPVIDELYIKSDEVAQTIELYDIHGVLLKKYNHTVSIPVSEIPNGLYYLKINFKNSDCIKSFVKH
jgi:hypothetical protein